jgi:hypothetical protein
MAGVAYGVTVTLPSGSLSEVVSVTANRTSSKSIGVNRTYNPNAGTVTFVSYDHPMASFYVRGECRIQGANIDFWVPVCYVESVDLSARVGGMVTYTTTVRLIEYY